MPADPLPVEWILGSMDPPVYPGMDLTHLICRNCKWSAAADADLSYLRNLEWLDISYNPLAETARTLPQAWDVLPLVAIKVCCNIMPRVSLLHMAAQSGCSQQSVWFAGVLHRRTASNSFGMLTAVDRRQVTKTYCWHQPAKCAAATATVCFLAQRAGTLLTYMRLSCTTGKALSNAVAGAWLQPDYGSCHGRRQPFWVDVV
jgi:hypothetical protein